MKTTRNFKRIYPIVENLNFDPDSQKEMAANTVQEGTMDKNVDTERAKACYEALNRCDRIPTFSEADTNDLDMEQESKSGCPMWCVPCRLCCHGAAPAQEVILNSAFLSVTFNWELTVEDTYDDSWSDETFWLHLKATSPINKSSDFVEKLSDVKPGPTLIENRACREAVISRFLGGSGRLGSRHDVWNEPGPSVHCALWREPEKIHLSKDGNTLVLIGGTTDNELTVFGRSTTSINDAALQVETYLDKLKKKLNDENAGCIENYKNVELGVKLFGSCKALQCIKKAVKSKGSKICLLDDENDEGSRSLRLRIRYDLEKPNQVNSENVENKLLQDYASDLHHVYKRYEKLTNSLEQDDKENSNDETEEDSVTGFDNNKKPIKSNSVCATACYNALQQCQRIPTFAERGGWKFKWGAYSWGCPHWCIPFRSWRHYPPRRCILASAFVSVMLTWNQTVEKTCDDPWPPTKDPKYSVKQDIPKEEFEKYIEAALDAEPGPPTLIDNRACVEAVCSRFFGESVGFNDDNWKKRNRFFGECGGFNEANYKETSISYITLSSGEPTKIHLSKDGNALVLIRGSELTIFGRSTGSIIDAAIVTRNYLDKLKTKLSEEKVNIDEFYFVELGVKLFGGSKVRKFIMEAVKAKRSKIVLAHPNGFRNPCVFNLRALHNVHHLHETNKEVVEKKLIFGYATDLHLVYHHLC